LTIYGFERAQNMCLFFVGCWLLLNISDSRGASFTYGLSGLMATVRGKLRTASDEMMGVAYDNQPQLSR
jgi:hypothetical protein